MLPLVTLFIFSNTTIQMAYDGLRVCLPIIINTSHLSKSLLQRRKGLKETTKEKGFLNTWKSNIQQVCPFLTRRVIVGGRSVTHSLAHSLSCKLEPAVQTVQYTKQSSSCVAIGDLINY